MIKDKHALAWLWLALVIIILDQVSKFLVLHYLAFWQSIIITPFLNLILEHNPGAAFSFLAGGMAWQHWLFSLIALVVSIFIIRWLYRLPKGKVCLPAGLALILGGALGNLSDRLIHGYVIDFVDFHIGHWHYATFNLADSAICIGAVLLLVDVFISPSKH